MTKDDELDISLVFELGETTWKVLVTMLSIKKPIGPRELARHLNLSSPSVALYHLDKLKEHGLVTKDVHGEYQIDPKADIGFLDNFLFLKQKIVPRTLFYAVFLTIVLAIYVTIVRFDYGIHNVFALVLGISGCAFLWAEVIRIWKGLV
ncbi:MAG: hypothetical protein BAJATHORv1_10596 [Candidatus Thorarchaeota archaeon]|nr:MAG: hypothetical protein BAJATHORv1_10596 [Candidatus Thorarchaeota archaeon]